MKICVFANDFSFRSGVERVASVIINVLVEQGHDVSVLSLSRGLEAPYPLDESVGLYRLFEDKLPRGGMVPLAVKRGMRFGQTILKLRRFFSHHRFDMVIDTEYMLGLMAAYALKGKNVYLVHWEHINFNIDPPGSRKRKFRERLAGMADGIVALTERDKGYWQQGARVKGHIVAINNPVPFDIPDNTYDPDSRVVLNVGRFHSQKGYDLLLKAWAQLGERVDRQGWTLRIVGEGETRAQIEALRTELRLEKSVELLPATPNVDQHYRSAAMFCMSSRYEGLAMVLIEAQAYGLPCVSFDCDTGPAEIIDQDRNGYLVEAGDTRALAEAMERVMDSRERRLAMSASARHSVERFDPAHVAEKWARYLAELTHRNGSAGGEKPGSLSRR